LAAPGIAEESATCCYAEHIQTEETTVFPAAARILDRATIAAIGSEFRARRNAG
jgi:hemerythrin-like domain-containing protein